jgi:hypothetical protein
MIRITTSQEVFECAYNNEKEPMGDLCNEHDNLLLVYYKFDTHCSNDNQSYNLVKEIGKKNFNNSKILLLQFYVCN